MRKGFFLLFVSMSLAAYGATMLISGNMTVKGPITIEVPATSIFLTLPGITFYENKISIGPQGLHCLPWVNTSSIPVDNGAKALLFDSTVTSWRTIQLPTMYRRPVDSAVLSDRLIISVLTNSGTGPVRLIECDLSGNEITNYFFGDADNRTPMLYRLASGGVACLDYRRTGSINVTWAYRFPSGVWTNGVFDGFPDNPGSPPCTMDAVQDPDGLFWILAFRDSRHDALLLRVVEDEDVGLVIQDDWDGRITEFVSMIPAGARFHAELPSPYATYDAISNVVMFSYQQSGGHDYCTTGITPMVAISVSNNQAIAVIATNTFEERTFPTMPIFPNTNAIGFLHYPYNEPIDCTRDWKRRFFVRPSSGTMTDLESIGANNIAIATSTDGWVFLPTDAGRLLTKMFFVSP